MLNRFVIQQSVQFHSFVGCSTIFILGGVFTDPEVDIVQQSVRILLFVRVQNDVRVTVVEATWNTESFPFVMDQSLFRTYFIFTKTSKFSPEKLIWNDHVYIFCIYPEGYFSTLGACWPNPRLVMFYKKH